MDIERVVAERLMEETGIPAFLEMPERDEDPGDLITVMRTGGGGSYMETVQVDVDCWSTKKGGGRKRAKQIADLVRAAALDLDEEPNIFHPRPVNTYRDNDPDTRRPRYVVQIELWVCE